MGNMSERMAGEGEEESGGREGGSRNPPAVRGRSLRSSGRVTGR